MTNHPNCPGAWTSRPSKGWKKLMLRSLNPRMNEFTTSVGPPAEWTTPYRVTITLTIAANSAAKSRRVRTEK